MRSIPSDIASKLAMLKQTKANSADPSANIWIGRPTTALINDNFLEKQTVLTATSITDSAVAVCHPRKGASNTKINIAYIASGVAHVVTAITKTKMSSHYWVDSGFEEAASAISIAYDGTMPKDDQGKVEFVTESQPWVFWVNSGTLYAKKLGTVDTITLAQANCTDVSAIRAMWSEVGGFDFGLIVFFILSGTIYYRQYIDGVWMDAETVTFGPSSVTWTDISAFRTWDYRVGVQGKTSDGYLYELFTQFMGVGKQLVEHLEIASILAEGESTKIYKHDLFETENVRISNVENTSLYGGLYSLNIPKIINAYNVDDGTGDYGKIAIFVFDICLKPTQVSEQFNTFSILDANSISYTPSSAILNSDGKSITLYFTDFNNASGECYAKYTTGSITTMAGINLIDTSCLFTPINLIPSEIPVPEVTNIYNY